MRRNEKKVKTNLLDIWSGDISEKRISPKWLMSQQRNSNKFTNDNFMECAAETFLPLTGNIFLKRVIGFKLKKQKSNNIISLFKQIRRHKYKLKHWDNIPEAPAWYKN